MTFPMHVSRLEAWTLDVADRVVAGKPQEDSRVELKATWPEAAKAARRLAGHANAARAGAVLWIIGLDEAGGVRGAPPNELADWLPQLRSHFDGVGPSIQDLVVDYSGSTLVSLLVDTSAAPFVVKNAAYGQSGAGPVTLEVPWRDGTAVRSARREDLIRILVPVSSLPEIELLGAHLSYSEKGEPSASPSVLDWHLRMRLYVTPTSAERVVIPFHKSSCSVALPPLPAPLEAPVRLAPPESFGGILGGLRGQPRQVHSLTIDGTSSELIIDGPGVAYLTMAMSSAPPSSDFSEVAEVTAALWPTYSLHAVRVVAPLTFRAAHQGSGPKWVYGDMR